MSGFLGLQLIPSTLSLSKGAWFMMILGVIACFIFRLFDKLKAQDERFLKKPSINQSIMKAFWVYILKCADGSYYTGHTDDLETRINQHHQGAFVGCYTFRRRPVELCFSQPFTTREEALTSERQIKGWSRKKKEALMRGDWGEISRLAKKRQS